MVPTSRMNHSGMHIAKQTVQIEVEITIGFHFEGFRMVNLVPQTALYRSTFTFSLNGYNKRLIIYES